jgi:hypothetical protein
VLAESRRALFSHTRAVIDWSLRLLKNQSVLSS